MTVPSSTCVPRTGRLSPAMRRPTSMTTRPMLAMTTAVTSPPTNTAIASPVLDWSPALIASNTMTAARAPIGSSKVLSHCNTLRTRCLGRTTSSSGFTTVGPETVTIAPIRRATANGSPMKYAVRNVALAQVRAPPTHTRRRTVPPSSLLIRRLPNSIPPWKRMMATTSATTGLKDEPRMAMGFAPGTRVPSTKPAGSSRTSAGIRSRGATTWHSMATAKMRVIPRVS